MDNDKRFPDEVSQDLGKNVDAPSDSEPKAEDQCCTDGIGERQAQNRGTHFANKPQNGTSGDEHGGTANEGDPKAAPKNKKVVYVVAGAAALVAIVGVLFSTHIICFHSTWEDATCEQPRHCGDCGKTEGSPLGHEWMDATCSEPKTCMRCGATEGEALGHKTNGWSEPRIDVVSAQERSTLTCEVCGEVVDEETTDLTTFVNDGRFIFSPSDFCKRLRNETDMDVIDGGDAELISYAFVESISNPDMCAMLSFSSMDGQTTLGEASKDDSTCNPSPVLMVDTEKTDSAEMMVDFIQACDPSLSYSEAVDVTMALAANVHGTSGSTEMNGIEYLLSGIDQRILFRAVIK